MTTLHSRLSDLAESFASEVLAAVRGAPLKDLIGSASQEGRGRTPARTAAPAPSPKARRSSGRLARRSQADIIGALDRVLALVKKHRAGLRAEQIRQQLGMQPKEMPRVLKEGIASKKLTSKGQKRSTTYFAK
jgi:hypothetical protein